MVAFARTLESLKTLRPNTSLMAEPPRVTKKLRNSVADLPQDGPRLDALKDSVAGIAAKAAASPPGPGGRRRVSSRGLVPGEPISPAVMNVLRAADRPLASAEVTVAMLQARGLDYRGKQLTAVVNRVSAILGELAKKKRIRRIAIEDEKERKWCLPAE